MNQPLYRRLPNGQFVLAGNQGQVYSMPFAASADGMLTRTHGLGAADAPNVPPQSHPVYMGPGIENDPQWDMFTKVPTWYPIVVDLASESGSSAGGSVPLRPEPFIAKRITWATTGDVSPNLASATSLNSSAGSIQGRSVTIQWMDEFTNFMGSRPVLLSALFGDSQGFLDLQRGLLFQGKQSLNVQLTRLFYPDTEVEPNTTRFDFVFHGIALLPRGINQSGSTG